MTTNPHEEGSPLVIIAMALVTVIGVVCWGAESLHVLFDGLARLGGE